MTRLLTLWWLLATCISAGTALAPFAFSAPNPPFTYTTTFVYTANGGETSLMYTGYQGERGSEPVAFHSHRLDFSMASGMDTGQMNTIISSIDKVFKNNGSLASVTFWSAALLASSGGAGLLRAPEEDEQRTVTSSPLACAGAHSLPSPWEALDWDWLELGSAGPVLDLGNETVSTPFVRNVTASHWQSISACRDIWLVQLANPANPATPFTVPVLYSIADPSSSPACDMSNRTYSFVNTTLLTEAEAAQSSALFSVPFICNATATAPSDGSPGSGAGIAIIWVALGCVLCAVVGIVVGVIFGRRQVFSQLQAQTARIQNAYEQSLIDAY